MSKFASATDLVPEPRTVLGTLLRPFSLGHHLLLQKTGLPFAGQPYAKSEPHELALGVFICAASHGDTVRSMFRGEWESEFLRWNKSIGPRLLRRARFKHDTEAKKFADYLSDGYAKPPVYRHQVPESVTLSAPWECLLKCRLVQAGFSESEVLEKYLPAAWYDYFTVGELRQADLCRDVARWRKVFYTEDDHMKMHPEEFAWS